MIDIRLHTATDGPQNCDRTILGKHVSHRNVKTLKLDRGKTKKIADEFRCPCGLSPRNEDYVKEHWKPGKRHEEDTYDRSHA